MTKYNIILLNKPVRITPLEAITRFKQRFPGFSKSKIGYAGRLDPLAEGLLLLLLDEENKKKNVYENLPKTYRFSFITGIETDTYDTLGIIVNSTSTTGAQPDIQGVLNSLIGKRKQAYPPYSSKTVHGKPLYWWARNNKLQEINIPEKEIEIYSMRLISEKGITLNDLKLEIKRNTNTIKGDFRQKEIENCWNKFFSITPYTTFPLFHCEINCSSGTYVRGLVKEIGNKLGTGAVTLKIKRTTIGPYHLNDALEI